MQRILLLLLVATAFGLGASAALAADPVHEIFSVSGSGGAPAGEICDFTYEFEFEATINRKRFFDENGNLVRRLQSTEERLVHRNAETGYELVEVVHYTTDLDVASGVVQLSGNSWHLRTTDGKIVLVLSGLEESIRATGEVIRATPQVGRGFENVICPALGGSPA
jgi:hypothetical protein